MAKNIREELRIGNYRKALKKLSEAINYIQLRLQKDDETKFYDVLDEIIK